MGGSRNPDVMFTLLIRSHPAGHPQMAIVAKEKCSMSPCIIPNSLYLSKVAVKSTPGFPVVGDLHLGVVSLAGLPQMAAVAQK